MSQFKNERTALNRIIGTAEEVYGIHIDKKTALPQKAVMSLKRRHVFFRANRKYEVLAVNLSEQKNDCLIVCDTSGNVGLFKKEDLAKITFIA